MDTISIVEEDRWEDMGDTFVDVVLEESSSILVSYEAVVIANKPSVPGNDFLPNHGHAPGYHDALGLRVVVDGIPFRQSGVKTGVRGVAEVDTSVVAGHLIASLEAGTHKIQLQWKKFGSFVRSWTIDETIDDGFHGGRTITVTAQPKHIWYTQPLETATIYDANTWTAVEDMNVDFTLTEKSTLRFMYHMPVSPDVTDGSSSTYDDIESQLEIDGVRYRETGSSVLTADNAVSAGILYGNIVLTLDAGSHKVTLYWKKLGTAVTTWRSMPSAYDGFVCGRVLSVSGDEFKGASIAHLNPVSQVSSNVWSDVGKSVMQFNLQKPSTVMISYSLPISQRGHPDFGSWSDNQWSKVAVRIVLDGVPYRHGSSNVDGNFGEIDINRGTLVLHLAAGSHTARLQWEKVNDASREWHAIRSYSGEFGAGGEMFLAIDSWNNKPSIIAPEEISGNEDEDISVNSVSIEDLDSLINPDYLVSVDLSVANGALTLISTTDIVLKTGDGTEDSHLVFEGKLLAINAALQGMVYRGNEHWFGSDTLTITVDDQSSIGKGGSKTDTREISVIIAAVNDLPSIIVPASQTLLEDGTLLIHGISVNEPDSELLELSMGVAAGKITLKTMSGLTMLEGSGSGDRVIKVRGYLLDVNNALEEILYKPDSNYNALQHSEALEIRVRDLLDSPEVNTVVSATVPIIVQDVNDPPVLLSPEVFSVLLKSYELSSPQDKNIRVDLRTSTRGSTIILATVADLVFLDSTNTGRSWIRFDAPLDAAKNALSQLKFTRDAPFFGTEVIYISLSYSDETGAVDETALMFHYVENNQVGLKMTSVSPDRGLSTGGTKIQVHGELFDDKELYCQFGPNTMMPATIVSDNLLTCATGANVNGPATSYLRLWDGAKYWSNAIRFTFEGTSIWFGFSWLLTMI